MSLETHFYDGKIKEHYEKLSTNLDKKIDQEELTNVIQEIKNMPQCNPSVTKALNLLLSESGNFDHTDSIDARLLIVWVWKKIKDNKPEESAYFFEQLSDIVESGSCPQGRVKRLFSVFNCCY